MKGKTALSILLLLMGSPGLFASNKPTESQSQQAKVLKVERRLVQEPDICCIPNDKPVQDEYYAYDVSVQVGCNSYDGLYETNLDYFPAVISPGKTVEVRLTKHNMFFNGVGIQNFRVPITHHRKKRTCGS